MLFNVYVYDHKRGNKNSPISDPFNPEYSVARYEVYHEGQLVLSSGKRRVKYRPPSLTKIGEHIACTMLKKLYNKTNAEIKYSKAMKKGIELLTVEIS